MVAADISRALLLGLISLAVLLGVLSLEPVYVIAFLAGVRNVVFDVAYYAHIPALVPRQDLVTANGKIQVSYTVAESAGPALSGVLIQVLTAPLANFATAGAFLVSALLGGLLVTPIGMQPALLLGAIGAALGQLWLLCTPLRTKFPGNSRVTPR